MMPLALGAGRWLLSGGWKWAGVALLALAVLFYRTDAHSWHKAFDAQKSAYVAAQAQATTKQIAANLATEAHGRAIAQEVDLSHAKALQGADVATERFIADHAGGGLCPGARQPGAATPAQGAGAAVPAISPADTIVVGVESGDVRTCKDDYEYASSAYQWAQKLIKDGLAQ